MSTPASHPHDDRMRTYRRTLGQLALAMLIAWVLLLAPLPYALAAGACGLVVLVLLVQVTVQGWRLGRRTGAALTALIGIPACLLLLGSTLASGIFYDALHGLQQCQHDALTQRSLSQCQERADAAITARISALLGS